MEQVTARYPVCTHIKFDGNRCGSPALTGANFCFQHVGGSTRATRARATSGANARLKFAWPGDREAIQHNLFLVAQALTDGRIDNATANTYTRLFRTCEFNLRRWEAARENDEAKRMPPPPDEAGAPHLAEMWEGSKPSSALNDEERPQLSTNGCHSERSDTQWSEVEELALSLPKRPAVPQTSHDNGCPIHDAQRAARVGEEDETAPEPFHKSESGTDRSSSVGSIGGPAHATT